MQAHASAHANAFAELTCQHAVIRNLLCRAFSVWTVDTFTRQSTLGDMLVPCQHVDTFSKVGETYTSLLFTHCMT